MLTIFFKCHRSRSSLAPWDFDLLGRVNAQVAPSRGVPIRRATRARASMLTTARTPPGKNETSLFGGTASGVAGDRGDDLAGVERPKRSAVSATPASSSSGVVPAQREGSGAAIPGHGKGRSALRLPRFAHWAALGGMTAPPLRNLSR